MMQRCYNPNHPRYQDWGGRGITVCDRWHVFENFVEDMGHPPKGLTLDRIDNNLGYCKSNCRLVNYTNQNINQRVRKDNSLGEKNISPTGFGSYRVNIYRNHKRFVSKSLPLDCAKELRDFVMSELEVVN